MPCSVPRQTPPPTDTKLGATVGAMFKGEARRPLLLNAHAYGTMSTIAGIAASGAFIGAAGMPTLSLLGFAGLRWV